nr:DNA-directed RNA polymerase subunit H [Natronorubrum tibetense]
MTTEGSDNSLLQHELVPEHRILPEKRTKQLLKEYDIERTDLPRIKDTDPAIEHLTCGPGDVIEVIRDSRTTDTAKNYRLVTGNSGALNSGGTSHEEWRNPADTADDLYTATEELTEDKALHILENIRAHVPPSRPGACEAIAVNRDDEITDATTRVREGAPYTFIQGELGYGKSFFLQWVRDRMFPTTAISFVDLDDEITFTNDALIVEAFWKNLETPRSNVNDQYANGLDEVWDTFLRQVANLCANYYEGQGYDLRKDRVARSLSQAVRDILRSNGVESEIADQLSNVAGSYFDTSVKSLSQVLEDDLQIDDPMNLISLMATLVHLNGYHVLLAVDELEKSDRTEEHFKAIDKFIERLPQGVSLFVTGTPELVTGGQEGNGMKETYQSFHKRTINNRITLEQPSREELIAIVKRVNYLETELVESNAVREYSDATENLGGVEEAVETFLSETAPSFRAFLTHLEENS